MFLGKFGHSNFETVW